MTYRRNPYMNRRFPHAEPPPAETPVKLQNIPLPNEDEETADSEPKPQRSSRPSILDFFRDRIHLEEIIILGLIFVLMQEEIDDDILLLLLVYILLG